MVRFWGPQQLFSTFKLIAKLESTCRLGLIRGNCIEGICLIQLIKSVVYVVVNVMCGSLYVTNCWRQKNYYNQYLIPPKMPKYTEKICDMRTLLKYAENAAKFQIRGSHISRFLTRK